MSTNSYMADYMRRRYHQRRAEAIALLGGACSSCGNAQALELDHINPATKAFDLAHCWSVSRDRYLAELAKCQLLCHGCHQLKSAAEASVEHGGGVSGKRNCKCQPCRERKREYNRQYRNRALADHGGAA